MTLLDAPRFDEARARRRSEILWISVGTVIALIVGFWILAGHPVDFPWNWYTHLRGRSTINHFFEDVEHNNLPAAYAIWTHDPDWQKHPVRPNGYTFDRFKQDWSSNSSENEYGSIQSHKIVAVRMSGNVLLAGIRINGLKSKALFINYDPKTQQLGFSPVELYLGP